MVVLFLCMWFRRFSFRWSCLFLVLGFWVLDLGLRSWSCWIKPRPRASVHHRRTPTIRLPFQPHERPGSPSRFNHPVQRTSAYPSPRNPHICLEPTSAHRCNHLYPVRLKSQCHRLPRRPYRAPTLTVLRTFTRWKIQFLRRTP